MKHKWEIKRNRYRAYYAVFSYRGEPIFRSLNFASKQTVKNLIESAKINIPGAPVVDNT